jgi:hypothetical protein
VLSYLPAKNRKFQQKPIDPGCFLLECIENQLHCVIILQAAARQVFRTINPAAMPQQWSGDHLSSVFLERIQRQSLH